MSKETANQPDAQALTTASADVLLRPIPNSSIPVSRQVQMAGAVPERDKVVCEPIESAGFIVTGAPGSGKTPVLRQLVRLGFLGVSEPARDILAERRAIGSHGIVDNDPQLFCRLMLERAIADYQRLEGADTPAFFDRGIPDMVGYAELFGLDPSAAWTASRRYRYREPVFVLPAWPEIYVTDGDRRMTFESARAFGHRVREVYFDLGYAIVEVPRDSVEARATFIAEHIPPL